MMTTRRIVETLRIKALVTSVNGLVSFDEYEPSRLENGIRLLDSLLGTTGSFRTGGSIKPENGSVLVDIVAFGGPDSETFDKNLFYNVCHAFQECLSVPINQEHAEEIIEERSIAFAGQFHFNAERVRKALSLVIKRKYKVSLLDEEDQEITLSLPLRTLGSGEEQTKMDVTGMRNICVVETDQGSYETDAAEAANLKVGDHVVIIEPSPTEKHRCIRADRATSVEDEPDFFK